jgi:hypothetical protein
MPKEKHPKSSIVASHTNPVGKSTQRHISSTHSTGSKLTLTKGSKLTHTSGFPDSTGSKVLPRNHARDVNAAHECPALLLRV